MTTCISTSVIHEEKAVLFAMFFIILTCLTHGRPGPLQRVTVVNSSDPLQRVMVAKGTDPLERVTVVKRLK